MGQAHRGPKTARAGKYYVAAEINRRGANAVTLTDDTRNTEVRAWDDADTRQINIRVRSRRFGMWQTTIGEGRPSEPVGNETSFWIFVDLSAHTPEFYIVPEWWIRNDIYRAHQEYLEKHGGVRPRTHDSQHHGIALDRIQQWKDRWDILGVFPRDDGSDA